jgi:hypothetical protein
MPLPRHSSDMNAAFTPYEVAGGAPVPETVPCPIMGKLATVANRIVDRGELCVPGEGASLSEHVAILIRPDTPGSRGRQAPGEIKISVLETV